MESIVTTSMMLGTEEDALSGTKMENSRKRPAEVQLVKDDDISGNHDDHDEGNNSNPRYC
jgi:hypothetical protein